MEKNCKSSLENTPERGPPFPGCKKGYFDPVVEMAGFNRPPKGYNTLYEATEKTDKRYSLPGNKTPRQRAPLKMFIRLFLLFTIVPLVELTLLIKIGNIFGVLHTIALVVITGVIGAYLARDQGLRVINELKQSLAEGRAPTDQIIEGALILISAVLLVTPGIITDVIGFLLVIPYTRKIMRDFLKEYFVAKIAQGAYKTYESSGGRVYYKSSGGFSDKEKKLGKDNDDDVIDV